MHKILITIKENLQKTIEQLNSVCPNEEPFSNAHSHYGSPGLTRSELIEDTQSLIDFIENNETDELGPFEPRIKDYVRRLQFLHTNTIPNMWSTNSSSTVSAFILTLEGLRKALAPALARDHRAEALASIQTINRQARSLESRFATLQPRTTSLTSMVERIEQAYAAADQLPEDLASLEESRKKLQLLLDEASKDQVRLLTIREKADILDSQLQQSDIEAKAVVARCESAYSAATSVGLAAAFSERSNALSKSMWIWVGGLVAALAVGSNYGTKQFRLLTELFTVPNPSLPIIALNLIVSLLSVGAPIWFAWLATKQIGQRFRLAEDYAYKSSISRAYEGFRREAARFDKGMEEKLLLSALTRLDELPLRLVETDSHGSPWHELFSSEPFKRAMKSIPGFATQLKDYASNALAAPPPSRRTSTQSEPAKPSE